MQSTFFSATKEEANKGTVYTVFVAPERLRSGDTFSSVLTRWFRIKIHRKIIGVEALITLCVASILAATHYPLRCLTAKCLCLNASLLFSFLKG
jgi:hypothetical protein